MTPPPVPADLNPAAAGKWSELYMLLSLRGSPPDAPALDMVRQYAESHAIRAEAVRQLNASSLLDRSTNGIQYPSAWLKVIDGADKTMDRVVRRLKLADAVNEEADDCGFDVFIGRQQ